MSFEKVYQVPEPQIPLHMLQRQNQKKDSGFEALRSEIIDPTILNSAKQRRYMSSDTNFATYRVPERPNRMPEGALS